MGKFYRSKELSVFGGICGGLSGRFGINLILVRVIAFLLVFTEVPILYDITIGNIIGIVYIIAWATLDEE